jgi:hypothetical protein
MKAHQLAPGGGGMDSGVDRAPATTSADEPGHAIDVTARIECRRVISGLITEYRGAA